MSDVRNRANSLNVTFPIPGVNNASQGFRDNTNATQQALFQASDEITKIQTTRFRLIGDAIGQSDRFDSAVVVGSDDPTLEIAFTLGNTLSGPVIYNSDAGDFSLTFDAKGRLVSHQVVQHTIAWAAGHGSNLFVPIVANNINSVNNTVSFPTFKFNNSGRLIETGTQVINNGLGNRALPFGSILIGGSNNLSRELTAPTSSAAFVLVIQGNTITWQPAGIGTASGVVGGNGINVDGNSGSSVVNLDIGKMIASPDIVNDDELIYLDASDSLPKRLTMAQLRGSLVKVVADGTPQLGGNLDVQNFSVMTTGNNGVRLQSKNTTPASNLAVAETGITLEAPVVALQAPSLTLNGQVYPATAGTQGQYLTQGAGNTLIWSSGQTFFQTFLGTIFVSTGGNDTTGSGSFSSPYRTINRALNAVPNNDTSSIYTIMLLGGTYIENVDIQNKHNISIEGFFGSTNSIIRGKVQVLFNINRLLMSKVTIDSSGRAITDLQPAFSIVGGIGEAMFNNCSFLRGSNAKSDLTAVSINGQLAGDINFVNCTIQGKIENSSVAEGNRVIFQNCGLPENGWTGLQVGPLSNTFVSGAPLMKGIEHSGGVLIMENIGSIISEDYTFNVENPDLPLWVGGRPKFITTTGTSAFEDDVGVTLVNNQDDMGNNVETLLLDPQGNPIEDPDNSGESLTTPWVQFLVVQPDTPRNFTVGLYSNANTDTGDGLNNLELTNVNFYNNGEFSKIYKEGNCTWSFTRVKRRSDQDFITGPRLAYDVQPDEGNFMGHFNASGLLLRYSDNNEVVPNGVIDPKSGNTFHITLTGSATLTLKTPEATSYAPGPLVTSGELYSELLIAVKQDVVGNRQVAFQISEGSPITWISNTAPNLVPGGLTFYLFRYFSRTRTWVGQKQVDAAGMKVTPVTSTSYTLQATDAGSYIRRSNTAANQVVVPENSSVQFTIGTQIQITQIGVGQTEIVPSGSVIINTPSGRFTRTRFSSVWLTKVAANTWDLTGDLDPAQTSVVSTTADNNLVNVSSNIATTDGDLD